MPLKNIEENKRTIKEKKSHKTVLNSTSCRNLRRDQCSFIVDESCSEFIDAICNYKELKGSPKKVTGRSPVSNNFLEVANKAIEYHEN